MTHNAANLIPHRFRADTDPRRRKAARGPHDRPIDGAPLDLVGLALILMIIAPCLLVSAHAHAGELSGDVSLSSQLVDRGLAITSATPALQGAIAWTTPSGWLLGLSGGFELRSPDHVAESVVRAAHTWALSENWRIQPDVVYYHYASRLHANVYEPGVYWLYRDILTFGLSGVYIVGADEHSLHPAADLNFHWPLTGGFSISGGLGITRYAVPYGRPSSESYHTGYYRYGQVGLLWSRGAWQVEIDRVAVDPGARRYLRRLTASSWLATISRSF